MNDSIKSQYSQAGQSRGLLGRLRRDIRGVTAVEFALVGLPFLMMLFGIIGVGLYFFTTFALENAVEQASRLLRTGQAQLANYSEAQFKSTVCEYVPGHIDCANKVKVNVLSFPDTTSIGAGTLPNCLTADGSMSGGTTFTPGNASEVVIVWACLEWDLAAKIPFIKLGNMASGARLIQATTVFRSEPYN